jgi:hypothetical protein
MSTTFIQPSTNNSFLPFLLELNILLVLVYTDKLCFFWKDNTVIRRIPVYGRDLMFAAVNGMAVSGIQAHLIRVEVDVSNGLPGFDIVGLPTTAVRESRERVRSAIKNSGFNFPLQRITVNLAPADIRKNGSGLDLP